MSRRAPHSVKVWAGVILFLGIGAAIAFAVASRMIDRGTPLCGAILLGSCAGGYGASFIFYVVVNAMKWIKGTKRSAVA